MEREISYCRHNFSIASFSHLFNLFVLKIGKRAVFPMTICFPSLVCSGMQFKARKNITVVRLGRREGVGRKGWRKSICISSAHDLVVRKPPQVPSRNWAYFKIAPLLMSFPPKENLSVLGGKNNQRGCSWGVSDVMCEHILFTLKHAGNSFSP